MKTLLDVVTAIVKELSASNAPFSAHDVTNEARKHVNNSTDQFDLVRGDIGNNVTGWKIDHPDVKAIIEDMFRNNELTRQFTGSFFSYQSATAAAPLTLTPLNTTMTNRMGLIMLVHHIVALNMNVSSLDDMVADIDANVTIPQFLSKYGLDSLDVIEFIMSLEEELDIDISDNDFEHLKNVEEVILMLADKFQVDPTATLYDKLKDIIEPWQSVIYPNATPVVYPAAAAGNTSITSDQILEYLKRVNKRHGGRRVQKSVKNIQSTLKVKGTKSIEIANLVEADPRMVIGKKSNGIHWNRVYVSIL
jgi:acyl carrier protein